MSFLTTRNSIALGVGGVVAVGSPPTSAAPPSFDPLTLPGIFRWYDAADASTVTLVGSKASQWVDKSPSAAVLTQSTDSNRYTYSTGAVNGLNAMVATGFPLNPHMVGSDLELTTTGWAVVVQSITGRSLTFGSMGPSSENTLIGEFAGEGSENMYCFYNGEPPFGDSFQLITTGPGMNDGQPHCFVFRNVASTASMWWDGENRVSGPWGAPSLIQGLTNTGDGIGLNGSLCEVMMGVGELTDADIAAITAYSQTKWGSP